MPRRAPRRPWCSRGMRPEGLLAVLRDEQPLARDPLPPRLQPAPEAVGDLIAAVRDARSGPIDDLNEGAFDPCGEVVRHGMRWQIEPEDADAARVRGRRRRSQSVDERPHEAVRVGFDEHEQAAIPIERRVGERVGGNDRGVVKELIRPQGPRRQHGNAVRRSEPLCRQDARRQHVVSIRGYMARIRDEAQQRPYRGDDHQAQHERRGSAALLARRLQAHAQNGRQGWRAYQARRSGGNARQSRAQTDQSRPRYVA